ncbi:MAG: mechanosensitive ion channel domain-containing protein [Pseudohongiellaceae bacterium]
MNGIRSALIPILLSLLALSAAPAQAQPDAATAANNPEQLASEVDDGQLQSLIDTLEDPERRAIFLERLNTLRSLQQAGETESGPDAAEAAPGLASRLMETASGGIESLTRRLQSVVAYINAAPEALNTVRTALTDPDERLVIVEIVAKIVGIFLLAWTGAWLIRHLLSQPWEKVRNRTASNIPNNIVLLVMALVLRLVPLAAFLGIAWLALPLFEPRPVTQTVLFSLVYAHVIAQGVMIMARTSLAVDNPEQRPYPLQDETAAYGYVWIRRITIVTVYGYFINQALLQLGMEGDSQSLLVDLTGLVVALLFVALILQNRQPVAAAIRGGEQVTGMAAQLRGTLGMFWHLLAILYIIGVYVVWATELEGGFAFLVWRTVATLVILLAARLALSGAQHGMEKLFHLPARLREQYPNLDLRADRYRPAVTQVLKIILVIVAVIALAQAWGLNAAGLFATEAGQALLARIVRILLIIAAGFLVWEITAALIERKLHAANGDTRRLVTVLPLLKNIVRISIGAVAIMIVLSELGMNIGPLIASAGVIGLAVGFGAQTLVRDLISGMFVIFEDIIAVGDWVEIGSHTGIVEAMHIRTMELRDLSGNIRVIPFGDVTSVHKVANDYSYALIVIGVAYREDVEEVMSLLSQIGEEMQQEEQWKDIILEPLMVDGLNAMASSSIDIRLRLKCKPLEQWALRREFLRRTKKLFDEKGIEIPFPHQTLYFGQQKDGSAPAAHIRLQEMARNGSTGSEKSHSEEVETTRPRDDSATDGPPGQ